MPANLLIAPTALAITLDEAKANLRIDVDDMDALIKNWIMGVTDHAEHLMGRAIMQQIWRVSLTAFPKDSEQGITLPYPPVSRIARVSYLDPSGIQQNIPPSRYLLDNASEPCRLILVSGAQWPATLRQANAIKIDIECGYGDSAAFTPQAIRLYLLAKLVEQFDPVVKPDKETVQSSYIDRLLDRYRIEEVG